MKSRHDLIAHLSGHFLAEPLPPEWGEWSKEQLDEYLDEHAWEPFEDWSATAVFNLIETLAWDVEQLCQEHVADLMYQYANKETDQ